MLWGESLRKAFRFRWIVIEPKKLENEFFLS
jgi:hypothetical protein